MIDRSRYRTIAALVFTLAVFFFCVGGRDVCAEEGPHATSPIVVSWVIDGDTIELRGLGGGERIRYVGIDTPEREEPFYGEARAMNAELVFGKRGSGSEVRFEPCASESRDKYGRFLGWVYVGGVDVGERLLSLGLARTLTIPPCGLVKAKAYREAEATAKKRGLGLWKEGK